MTIDIEAAGHLDQVENPKIIGFGGKSTSLQLTFEDGLVHEFSLEDLRFPSEILERSVGVSGYVIAFRLAGEYETRAFAARYLRNLATRPRKLASEQEGIK